MFASVIRYFIFKKEEDFLQILDVSGPQVAFLALEIITCCRAGNWLGTCKSSNTVKTKNSSEYAGKVKIQTYQVYYYVYL